mgnify:CR=1 FL=1
MYRVHPPPTDEKLYNLRVFLGTLGVSLPPAGTVHPRDLDRVLKSVADTPELEALEATESEAAPVVTPAGPKPEAVRIAEREGVLGAKARAVMAGRPAPSVADIREVALAVLRHRIIPNYNATGDGITAADIVGYLLEKVPEPKYE